jgi:hypothetical protein
MQPSARLLLPVLLISSALALNLAPSSLALMACGLTMLLLADGLTFLLGLRRKIVRHSGAFPSAHSKHPRSASA